MNEKNFDSVPNLSRQEIDELLGEVKSEMETLSRRSEFGRLHSNLKYWDELTQLGQILKTAQLERKEKRKRNHLEKLEQRIQQLQAEFFPESEQQEQLEILQKKLDFLILRDVAQTCYCPDPDYFALDCYKQALKYLLRRLNKQENAEPKPETGTGKRESEE